MNYIQNHWSNCIGDKVKVIQKNGISIEWLLVKITNNSEEDVSQKLDILTNTPSEIIGKLKPNGSYKTAVVYAKNIRSFEVIY